LALHRDEIQTSRVSANFPRDGLVPSNGRDSLFRCFSMSLAQRWQRAA